MRHHTKYIIIISLLFITTLFWACGSPDMTETPAGQDLTVCLPHPPLSIDPRFAVDESSRLTSGFMFNSLVKKGPNFSYLPDLAQSWEMEDDKTWVFYLRPDVKFHNERELKAEDVVYTLQSMMDPEVDSPKKDELSVINKIEIRRPGVIAIHTREPYAPLLSLLTTGIIPAVIYKIPGKDFAKHPIGTGPYRFIVMQEGKSIELAAFKDYFKGAPEIDELTLEIIPHETDRYLELIKGNLDLVQNAVATEMIPVLDNKKEFRVINKKGNNCRYIGFNCLDPVLKKPDVRRAIAHAINIDEMAREIHMNLQRPAVGLLPPEHWAYEPDLVQYGYDPEESRRLLDKAGFGIKENGRRFTIRLAVTKSETDRLIAEIFQQYMADVGINLEATFLNRRAMDREIKMGSYQLYSSIFSGTSDPDSLRFPASNNGSGGRININADLKRLFMAGRSEMNREKRKVIYSQIQKIIASELPCLCLWRPDNVVVMKSKIIGFHVRPDGDISGLWNARWSETAESESILVNRH